MRYFGHIVTKNIEHLCTFFSWLQWGLNPGPHACWTGIIPLEPLYQPYAHILLRSYWKKRLSKMKKWTKKEENRYIRKQGLEWKHLPRMFSLTKNKCQRFKDNQKIGSWTLKKQMFSRKMNFKRSFQRTVLHSKL
jgi:hypothetical protein